MVRRSTREMFLKVATGLFATAGLRRTTMETIAEAAGRGRRTLYMYFGNKAEIYDAVVENELRVITGPLRSLTVSDDPFDVVIRSYSEERTRQLHALCCRNPLLQKDFALGHSRVERLRERLQRLEIQILTPFFFRYSENERSAGQTLPEDNALIFLNMLRGNDLMITKTDGLSEAIRLSSVSADLFIRGLAGYKEVPA